MLVNLLELISEGISLVQHDSSIIQLKTHPQFSSGC